MSVKLHRLNMNIQFSIILALFFAALVGFVPNYERLIYLQTESVKYGNFQNHSGYPAGDDVPKLKSRGEIMEEHYGYTLTVDAKNITPLHIFLGLSDNTVSKSAFKRFLNRDDNQKAYGQLYSVVLENGDTMIVLLDDYAVKLQQSGTVKLPIGKTEKMGNVTKEYLTEKYYFSDDELAYYIDMASGWRKSNIAERIVTVRLSISLVTFIIVAFVTYFITTRIERKEKGVSNG